MFVKNAMTRQVETVAPGAHLKPCWEKMQDSGYEALPVRDTQTGELVGIVTAVDLVNQVLTDLEAGLGVDRQISEVMTGDIQTIAEDEILEEAARIMYEKDFTALPVTGDRGKLVGIVTLADLGRMIIKMTGFTEPGTRISLLVPDRPGKIADIANIVRSCGESISSVATYTPERASFGNVVLRLKTHSPREVVQSLRDAGYRVLHVSQEWE